MTKINNINNGKKVGTWGSKKTIITEYGGAADNSSNKNYSWLIITIVIIMGVIVAACIL